MIRRILADITIHIIAIIACVIFAFILMVVFVPCLIMETLKEHRKRNDINRMHRDISIFLKGQEA
jgi:hypothetical protein